MKYTKKSILSAFLISFCISLTTIGGGVILASFLVSDSFIQKYSQEQKTETETETLESVLEENNDQKREEKKEEDKKDKKDKETVIYDEKKYHLYFEKLTKRAEILDQKNTQLETQFPIATTVDCLQDMTFEEFKNFDEHSNIPEIAFSNALGYCSFADFSQKVQNAVDANMYLKQKKDAENRVHSFAGVHVPQSVINQVLDKKNWDAQTQTLLGNKQNITHDISDSQNRDLEFLGIQELIGVGLSTYYHSSNSRKVNLRNAISKLDGKIIHPNQTLSIVNSFAPFSYNNGYINGIIIQDGKDVKAMGGGVCQSVTTMFRAWQNSGLEITKFQPHSKSISYYGGIGLDATIYKAPYEGGDVDLILKNNSENSILIKVVDSDPYQMVFLYGTRDRDVSLERYHFSKYNGNQVAKWKRSIQYEDGGDFVENYFQEWQKLY